MSHRILAAFAAFVLVHTVGLAPRARAQTQAWNQEVVTATAGELEEAVSGLREVVRASPNLNIPTKRRRMYMIVDNLRMIEYASSSLHAELRKGAGMEETLPTYQRLQRLRRDTEVLAQQVDITEVTRPKLDKAKELLAKIEPFYPAQPEGPAEKSSKARAK